MRVREAQVLVQVVQPVQKVAHVPSKHAQDALVAEATDVRDESVADEAHHIGQGHVQDADGRLQELRHDRLAVAFLGDEQRVLHPGRDPYLIGREIQ